MYFVYLKWIKFGIKRNAAKRTLKWFQHFYSSRRAKISGKFSAISPKHRPTCVTKRRGECYSGCSQGPNSPHRQHPALHQLKWLFALATYGYMRLESPLCMPSAPPRQHCLRRAVDNLKKAVLIAIKALMHYLFPYCSRALSPGSNFSDGFGIDGRVIASL